MLSDLVEVATPLEAGGVSLNEDERHAAPTRGGIGLGHHDHDIAMISVGDVDLRSVDDEVAAVPSCGGRDALEIGTGAGLGHRDRGDDVAGYHAGQILSLLLLRSVGHDIIGHDVGMQREASPEARVAELLVDDGGCS